MGLQASGRWVTEGLQSFQQVVGDLERTLKAARELGAKNTEGRFAEYLTPLRQAASFSYPRVLPWAPRSPDTDRFVEACSQVSSLLKAAKVWPSLPTGVAKHKLTKILAGNALPVADLEADGESRNFLVEFSVAHLLQLGGFKVSMTVEKEDVRALCDGYPDIVIECKRPAGQSSLPRNVKDSWSQLRKRGDASATTGMLVISIDRMLDSVPSASPDLAGIPSFETFAEVMPWVSRASESHLLAIRAAAHELGIRLYPEAAIAAVLLTVPVFSKDEGLLRLVDQIAFFNTDPRMDDVTRRVIDRLLRGPAA